MNPSDVIVICALGLPVEHCRDLLTWYLRGIPEEVLHPSIFWWCDLRQRDVAERYFRRY